MQKPYSALVEFAKSRLVDLGNVIVTFDVPVVDQESADLLACLEDLCAQYERDRTRQSDKVRSLSSVDIANAWRRGTAPDGFEITPRHEYLEKLEALRHRCSTDAAAFDALALHASARIAEDLRLTDPLRHFLCDHLNDKLKRPRPPGRPRKTALPDLVVAQVVGELVETYGLRAIGSVASEHEGSACAIVAEAMRALRRQPSSTSAVAAVWFAAKRADRG